MRGLGKKQIKTIGTFLNILKRTKRIWFLTPERKIRCRNDNIDFCPITRVAKSIGCKAPGSVFAAGRVGREYLGLLRPTVSRIIGAADDTYPTDVKSDVLLRQQLLAACGLD